MVQLIKELSFLKLGTEVEALTEGYQFFWSHFIGGIKYFGKSCEISNGLRNFRNIFQTEVRIMYSFTTKVSSVSAVFIRQERSYLK